MSDFRITIKETCSCGATLELEGEFNFLSQSLKAWAERHPSQCAMPPMGEDDNSEFRMEYIDADHVRLTPMQVVGAAMPKIDAGAGSTGGTDNG